ncbi:MAG: hypothetical protein ABI868_06735 [Acidobacteriota bacterium]
MPKKTATRRSRRLPPIVTAVVQPVTKRLSRMEALLMEMRSEQDVHLKHIARLQSQIDVVAAETKAQGVKIRRLPQLLNPRRR